MRILSLILLSFVISAAVETNCETLGYEYISDDSSFQETCESWLVCPANANYKICTKWKTDYIYTKDTCPTGATCEQEEKYRLIGCLKGYSEKYDDNGNLSACEKTSNCPGSPLRCVSNACEFTKCNDGTYDYSGRCSDGFEKYTSIGGVLSDLMRTDLHCALCNCAKSACKTDSTAGATSYAELENGGYVHLSCESSSTTDANGCLFCCPAGYAKAQKYMGTAKASTVVGQVPEYDYSYVDRGCVSTVCSFDWQLIAAPLGALGGYIFPDDKLAIINQCILNYAPILDDNGCITRCEPLIASSCIYKTLQEACTACGDIVTTDSNGCYVCSLGLESNRYCTPGVQIIQ